MVKLFGAGLIILGCCSCGFSMAQNYRRKERYLKALHDKLQLMYRELSCRGTPLPDLFALVCGEGRDPLDALFAAMSRELSTQQSPDAQSCMTVLLNKDRQLPEQVKFILSRLGASLGSFDLSGQLQQLDAVADECAGRLRQIADGRDTRLRNYQTLGLCAGAALAILLL